MLALLVLIFIVVPIAELYVIIQVGQAIGVLETIGLLILDSLLGALMLRSQGRRAWTRFNAALAEGRVPGREIADGALIIFGGALLLTPGFITDALGLLLLLPPTRAVIRRVLSRTLFPRLAMGHTAVSWGWQRTRAPGSRYDPGPGGGGQGRPYDLEGTAHEVDDRRPGAGGDPPALPR